MNDEKFFELVTKYLSKEASYDEIGHMNSLIKKNHKYFSLFSAIKERWEKAEDSKSLSEFNSKRGLKLLTEKILKHDSSFQWDDNTKQKYFFSFHNPYFKVAASFAFVLILVTTAYFTTDILNQRSISTAWNEKKTVMGEHIVFNLLDGTRITLNADSKLRYPARFGDESREVYLDGEAYFEVTHHDYKPFVVHTGGVSTVDLGTKFNVKAFPGDKDIIVSLEEGKVEVFENEAGRKKDNVVLTPAQQLIFDKKIEVSKIGSFDLQEAIGWKDNILIFDNELLSNVLVSLERSYGVKFELEDKSFSGCTIKADFKNESFWTVAEVLKKATGLTYKPIRENNALTKIVFCKK